MSEEAYDNIKPIVSTLQAVIMDFLVTHPSAHYKVVWRGINTIYNKFFMPMTISSRLTELRKLGYVATVDSLNSLTERGMRVYHHESTKKLILEFISSNQ